jgi:hypothetical protein
MSKRVLLIQSAAVVFMLLAAVGSLRSQQLPDCDDSRKEPGAPDYKIGRTAHLRGNNDRFFLEISVEPKFFTKASMTLLSGALNRRFCKEQRVEVFIADDYRAASVLDPLHDAELYEPAVRARYYLDRQTGEEHIDFSTRRGRQSDVFLDLGRKKTPFELRTYRGRYLNHNFGYTATIPSMLEGLSEVPGALESGIQLKLSPDRERNIWIGAGYNTARYSLRFATEFRLEWLRGEGAVVQSVKRQPVQLGRLRGERVTVRYKSPASSDIKVQDFVIVLRPQRDEYAILYQIEMQTSAADYATDVKTFDQIAQSWRYL